MSSPLAGLRIGQNMFNFLEWLRVKKNYNNAQSLRMADPFFIEDDELERLMDEYEKECQSVASQ